MTAFKYIPEIVNGYAPGYGFYVNEPVTKVVAYPPGQHPAGKPIKSECTLVEIHTRRGVKHYGVTKARIDSNLRMAVELWPGCERDEVVAKWDDAPSW